MTPEKQKQTAEEIAFDLLGDLDIRGQWQQERVSRIAEALQRFADQEWNAAIDRCVRITGKQSLLSEFRRKVK